MISVVIRSKDEADRLRLTLASLIHQIDGHELIVVNDGSSDHTNEVISEVATYCPITAIQNEKPLGRSGASNAGANIAKGDILLFLDGDVISSPNLLSLHQQYHQENSNKFARGENRHLRCTRSLLNPELGTPFPTHLNEVNSYRPNELNRLKVTIDQIYNDFLNIDRRSSLGIYPGIHPQTLFNLEINAITESPNSTLLWAAASGQNSSVAKSHFIAVNGFDEKIDINEHRELALKLSKIGVKVGYIAMAKSYHMIHQSGWRNPLEMPDWERRFLTLHPLRAVALLNIFWATIAKSDKLPPPFRIHNFLELEAAALNFRKLNYDEVRINFGLDSLGRDFWISNT
jgi:glycosyltransferase involved in cell wall biosynthesis